MSSPAYLIRPLLSVVARVLHAVGIGWLANDASWLVDRANQHGLIVALSELRLRLISRRRLHRALGRYRRETGLASVKPPLACHPVVVRHGTSDPLVYGQVFVEDEYGPFNQDDIEGLVIDCGANVGYSTVFFLSRWPRCTVVAVEPDPDNFRVLQENLRPYGSRAVAVWGGVWNKPGYLALSSTPYRDGGFWARQVVPVNSDAANALPAFDIPSLMEMAGSDRIALLKVDIEGAEAVVFDDTSTQWIGLVDRVAIELHGDTSFGDCKAAFFTAIANEDFVSSQSGELTLCRRRALRSHSGDMPC